MSGKRQFPYHTAVQGFELQRRKLEEDPSRWVHCRRRRQCRRRRHHRCWPAAVELSLRCLCGYHRDVSVFFSLTLSVPFLQGEGGAQGVAGAGADGAGRI